VKRECAAGKEQQDPPVLFRRERSIAGAASNGFMMTSFSERDAISNRYDTVTAIDDFKDAALKIQVRTIINL
jgi:hypothetical protein